MSKNYTPGPWKTNENAAGQIWIQAGSGFIAEITPAHGEVPEKLSLTREANARLITSSPELLQMLERIELQLAHRMDPVIRKLLAEARPIINSANGEQ